MAHPPSRHLPPQSPNNLVPRLSSRPPIVETTGTGGGFKAFCQDIGPVQPSVSNASRPIKASEIELCHNAGVTELVEIKIGFDGIVLANAKDGPVL